MQSKTWEKITLATWKQNKTKQKVPTVTINIKQRSTRTERSLSVQALAHGPHLSTVAATPVPGHASHRFGPSD